MSDLVHVHHADGICTVQLNRTDKKNALNTEMYDAMSDTLDAAERSRDIAVIVFCGTAGCFTAGNDLQDFLARTDMHAPRPAHRFIRALMDATVPLIAAVDGYAVGIGTTMLLHCDFIYATPGTKFRLPFVDLGLCPEAGSSLLLQRLIGYPRAAELLMLGEPFDGTAAMTLGLVSTLCEPDRVLETAYATARKLSDKPRAALRATKTLMRRPEEDLGARVEAEVAYFAKLLELPASKEIMTAFIEKRRPDRSRYD
jgi:enoyl-CoA hydratase/carnithine racemase